MSEIKDCYNRYIKCYPQGTSLTLVIVAVAIGIAVGLRYKRRRGRSFILFANTKIKSI